MKKKHLGFWYFFFLFALAFLFNSFGVFGQEKRQELISIGGVYLDFAYDHYITKVTVGGVQGTVISSLNDSSVVITLFFIPCNDEGNVAINKLEYSDIMEEINKSLNLGIIPGVIFNNPNKIGVSTVFYHKSGYEVWIKTIGIEDIYLSIRVSKL